MKYQRLVLRYADRVSGSSFAEPSFRVNLQVPYDKPVKVHLESAFINTDKDNTSNQSYVRISLKNTAGMNSIVSKDGGFIHDGVLGRIGFTEHQGHSTYNIYNLNSQYNDKEGALICFPNQTFKLGILDLKLTYGENDSKPIIFQNDAVQDNYCIVLGIYCDDDEY